MVLEHFLKMLARSSCDCSHFKMSCWRFFKHGDSMHSTWKSDYCCQSSTIWILNMLMLYRLFTLTDFIGIQTSVLRFVCERVEQKETGWEVFLYDLRRNPKTNSLCFGAGTVSLGTLWELGQVPGARCRPNLVEVSCSLACAGLGPASWIEAAWEVFSEKVTRNCFMLYWVKRVQLI